MTFASFCNLLENSGVTNVFAPIISSYLFSKKDIISELFISINSKKEQDASLILQLDNFDWENIRNHLGDTLLHSAVYYGSCRIANILVNRKPKLTTIKNNKGDLPLHDACSSGYLENVKCVLKKGSDSINMVNENGDTALHLASKGGHFQVVDFLLKNYPNLLNIVNNDGNTALHLALLYYHHKVAAFLVSEKANLFISNKQGVSNLDLALKNRNLQFIEILLDNLNPNIGNNNGDTLLHVACKNENLKLVEILLNKDADPNIRNYNGDTPLHIVACKKRDSEQTDSFILKLFEMILSKKPDLRIKNNKGNTVLHLACSNNNFSIIDKILAINPDLNNEINNEGKKPKELERQFIWRECTPEFYDPYDPYSY